MIGAMAITAAFALAGLVCSQLNLTQRYIRRADALNLAEAAVHEAVGRLHEHAEFGTKREQVSIRLADDRWALVSFDPSQTEVETSTNTITADGSSGTAHLVGVGVSGGVRREVEVLLAIPPYQFAVSTAGPLESQDGIEVTALDEGIDEATTNLASNASVKAEGRFLINGDLLSPRVELPDDATVLGRIITGGEPVDLPNIALDDWDPRSDPELASHTQDLPTSTRSSRLRGPFVTRRDNNQGDLTVNGNLTLDRGLVFVQGDLTVNGELTGQGALIVKGKTHITGAVDMSGGGRASSRLALLSEGDVELLGRGETSEFRGLIYTRGGFLARQVQITGAFVQAPPRNASQGLPAVSLKQVRFEGTSEATRMNITVGDLGLNAGAIWHETGLPPRIKFPEELPPDLPGNVRQTLTSGLAAMDRAAAEAYSGTPCAPLDYVPAQVGGVAPSVATVSLQGVALDETLIRSAGKRSAIAQKIGQAPALLMMSVERPPDSNSNHVIFDNGWFSMQAGKPTVVYRVIGSPREGLLENRHVRISREDAARLYKAKTGASLDEDKIIDTALAAERAVVEAGNRALRAAGVTNPSRPLNWQRQLDLNRFLQDTRPLRVLSWRER